MHVIRNGQLLTFHPGTSSDSSPAVCWIRSSKGSLQYKECHVASLPADLA